MHVEKEIIGNLEKCYSIAPLYYKGKNHILVAAEKKNACLMFDLAGNFEETIWEEPGGTMSMVQVPNSDGVFLATHQFYSPNDSKEAKIVYVTPKNGKWEVQVLAELPFVHRFGIISRNNVNYLIACTLKSGHSYKDDWSSPGKVYVCQLPEDLSVFSEKKQINLEVIKENMLKNHGYYQVNRNGIESAVISCEEGVFLFAPPENSGETWQIEELISEPASDGVLLDLDGDGEEELIVISPFHGDNIYIYKRINNQFKKIYTFPEKLEFSHAIYGGDLNGKPAVVIGHRKGARNLLSIFWNEVTNRFESIYIDQDCGSTNVFHYIYEERDIIISANREKNEIARYVIQ